MPHITGPMAITDGLATPVARSFAPRLMSAEESLFAYSRTIGDTPNKRVTFGVKWSDSTPKRPTVRQVCEVTYPILRPDAGGVIQVAAIGRSTLTHVVPDIMTEAEVLDMIYFMFGGAANANIRVGVTTREPIWG